MLFNAAEAPIVAAAAGLGITHTADLLVAEYVARGELQLILEKFIFPGRRSRWSTRRRVTRRPRCGCFPISPPT